MGTYSEEGGNREVAQKLTAAERESMFALNRARLIAVHVSVIMVGLLVWILTGAWWVMAVAVAVLVFCWFIARDAEADEH